MNSALMLLLESLVDVLNGGKRQTEALSFTLRFHLQALIVSTNELFIQRKVVHWRWLG